MVTWKFVPAAVLFATRCGSQTHAPAETGNVRAQCQIAPCARPRAFKFEARPGAFYVMRHV
jgi:hypothetical protein